MVVSSGALLLGISILLQTLHTFVLAGHSEIKNENVSFCCIFCTEILFKITRSYSNTKIIIIEYNVTESFQNLK